MGMVYRARRALIGDEVAVKVLLQKFVADTDAVERFRREARAAAMLRHPNVVTIHDFGEARGEDAPAYIVMELVEGESLRDLLRRAGRGSNYIDIRTPTSNLRIPSNGPTTSGGATQFQLNQPAPINPGGFHP